MPTVHGSARFAELLLPPRVESERQDKRRALGWKVDGYLGHIEEYLEQEIEFDGGYWEMRRERDRLRPLIRQALIDELLEDPDRATKRSGRASKIRSTTRFRQLQHKRV